MEEGTRRSCAEKFDVFLWGTEEHKYAKATNTAPWMNHRFHIIVRSILCLWSWFLIIFGLFMDKAMFFAYFTSWGLMLNCASFTLFMVGHWKDRRYEKLSQSSDDPFGDFALIRARQDSFWKWPIFLFC